MLNKICDRALDWLWDATLPLSSRCPVCAFWRGFALGVLIGAVAGALS